MDLQSLNFLQNTLSSNPFVLAAMLGWILIWKGFALWKAAQKQSKSWFIAILVLNTMGILDILYIFVFSDRGKGSKIEEKSV